MTAQTKVASELQGELGAVRIANEVVSIVAGLAATEVPGVAGMSGGLAGGIAEKLGRKNLGRGVKVEVGEKETAVDIFVIVEYGVRIPEVANQIQSSVKRAIETMTGLVVVEVNVHVQGVVFSKEEEVEEEAEAPARVR
ncbi:MAG: Asp23/Gls24 family envelope stress response protein [Eubacteriales bacterium]|nr:Asp23/Gls24 family envelope stress response protein [Bacillota bacterium]MBV1727268.1 Asp23/Gls24 family envelope stress response protein [Desulforudis sp.]MDZ4043148.1 Asp23/Gls24 family envelope stress response protein [Eubacteriales bacterium]MBU4554595.1 Asp23/Gls24 family envelope stress response protein [Bacillota bacterium]MBV1736092.1 Asp23/Gls24 family envelope stress response protein [Desulforudis sp.]